MTRSPADVLSLDQVAVQLNRSQRTVYRLVSEGHLRSTRDGRRLVVRAEDVREYLERTSVADEVDAFLRAEMKRLRASSFTLYVPDPWFPSELQLVYMPGVRIQEPMHGFLFPRSSAQRLFRENDRETQTDFPSAKQAEELRDQLTSPLAELASANPLFASFADRESVGACVRLRRFGPDGKPELVLWVNFANRHAYESGRRQLQPLFEGVVQRLSAIRRKAERDNPFPSTELITMMTAVKDFARPEVDADLFLKALLDISFSAFGLTDATGLGSVFLYDENRYLLRRGPHRGIRKESAQTEHDVRRGEGVISWVALKGRSLLIPRITDSQFYSIYVEADPDVHSELAVPLVAGDKVIGVLNLESRALPSPFTPQGVRAVWMAASQAVVAYRLAEQTRRLKNALSHTGRLLQLARDAARGEPTTSSMKELEGLACSVLGARFCDIWTYHEGAFRSSGTTSERATGLPRPDGWSDWIRRERATVWIAEIRSSTNFNAKVWRRGRGWTPQPLSGNGTPSSLNENLLGSGVGAELGLPILLGKRFVGVAWVKFEDREPAPPAPEFLQLAQGFAAQAGLVLDVVQHQNEIKGEAASRLMREPLGRHLFPEGPVTYQGLDGFVAYRPDAGHIAADFWALESFDESTTCFLIGKVGGSGPEAALGMLPIVTAFRSTTRESASAKHLLSKLSLVCRDWRLVGSALCFVVQRKGNRIYLFGSSAGHEPLLLLRANGERGDFPGPVHIGGSGNGLEAETPLAEDAAELFAGDLVVAFTAGVSQALVRSSRGSTAERPLGREGIRAAVVRNLDAAPPDIAQAILKEGRIGDDRTAMVLRVVVDGPETGEKARGTSPGGLQARILPSDRGRRQ